VWYTKRRRAQSAEDFETWIEGGVTPTLNSFDNGDVRAVVIIVTPYTESSFANYAQGVGTIRASGGSVGYGSETLIVETEAQTMGFSHTQGLDIQATVEGTPTIRANGGGMAAVIFEPGSVARNAGPAGESELSPTLRAKMGDNQPAMRKGDVVRRLTPIECERLQGFPDDWTNVGSDAQRYKQMGNAVTVNVIKWIGRNL
jgi:DNA (cytosine-5)-methyltransferase 1